MFVQLSGNLISLYSIINVILIDLNSCHLYMLVTILNIR